jgi:antitoxin (DNA-binding transcriptional repressor) of toxin-antitoxin stability system
VDAAFELSLDEVGEHIADLQQAARDGNVVYLTEGGQRLAVVVPFESEADVTPRRRRLAAVSGVLPGFERDVDVEASRDGWARH